MEQTLFIYFPAPTIVGNNVAWNQQTQSTTALLSAELQKDAPMFTFQSAELMIVLTNYSWPSDKHEWHGGCQGHK